MDSTDSGGDFLAGRTNRFRYVGKDMPDENLNTALIPLSPFSQS